MDSKTDSLRDRKHAETRRAIETIALDLAVSNGLAGTTVDDISAKANISRRTFFNYYSSKEDALLGFSQLSDFSKFNQTVVIKTGDDMVRFTIHTLLQVFEHSISNFDLKKRRAELLKSSPKLLDRHLEILSKIARKFVDSMLASINNRTSPESQITKPQAEVILMLCCGAVKVAAREWISEGKKTPYKNIEERAIKLVKEATGVVNG